MNPDIVLQYLIELSSIYFIPGTVLIVSTWRLFRQLRSLTPENYQEKVRETDEEDIIEKMSERLDSLFREYGLTPPTNSVPFPMAIRRLLNETTDGDRLTTLSSMFNSLVENGQDSPLLSWCKIQWYSSQLSHLWERKELYALMPVRGKTKPPLISLRFKTRKM